MRRAPAQAGGVAVVRDRFDVERLPPSGGVQLAEEVQEFLTHNVLLTGAPSGASG